ncbi:E3 ubiquitin-protein ligase znrf2 isoform X2 [Chironomus tepperi]|uniref:E3 ubiquitin-protein ligase znrf2 isoform X2 n=1 Tax=Chironomus tepperi TaxID=113505 RepID=UPI00391F5DDA
MGAKASTAAGNQSPRTFSNSSSSDVVSAGNNATSFNFLRAINSVDGVSADSRQRARSAGAHFDLSSNSPEESNSHDENNQMHALGIGRVVATSLPSHIWSLNGFKCPVCSKFILPDDIECHIVMCLTKPRLSYNEDVLNDPKGECVICLEDLKSGDVIARLPCLCIYHKGCIDKWFEVNRSCPEHPSD